MGHVARLRVELTIEQRRGGFIKRAAQPQDHHARATLGADGERPGHGPLRLSGWHVLAALRGDLCVRLVHPRSKCRSDHETVTGG